MMLWILLGVLGGAVAIDIACAIMAAKVLATIDTAVGMSRTRADATADIPITAELLAPPISALGN